MILAKNDIPLICLSIIKGFLFISKRLLDSTTYSPPPLPPANDFFDQTTLSTALPPWPDLTPANANDPTESAPSKHEATGVGFHHFDEPAAILASMLLIAPRRRRQFGSSREEGTVEAPYSLCTMDSLDRCTCRVGLRTRLSSFTLLSYFTERRNTRCTQFHGSSGGERVDGWPLVPAQPKQQG
ncbi:hypothetical protein NL676_000408 [Syzygium grande]|nr:hypothetical protein NL676_000408 [Syzygium grande]